MLKYESDLILAPEIIIDTERCCGDFLVTVRHTPTNKVVSAISESQIDAYNQCIKNLEWIVKNGDFIEFYKKYPDKFLEVYLGLKLKWYQKILIRSIKCKN